MYVALHPRGGGWVDGLFHALEHLQLARTVTSDEAKHAPLPRVPFVLVCCDADRSRPIIDPLTESILTYPCANQSCMLPAAFGCRHCQKHGGRGARRLVESIAQCLVDESRAGRREPRRILFAAPREDVRDAYRRALVCVSKLGSSLRKEQACPGARTAAGPPTR